MTDSDDVKGKHEEMPKRIVLMRLMVTWGIDSRMCIWASSTLANVRLRSRILK